MTNNVEVGLKLEEQVNLILTVPEAKLLNLLAQFTVNHIFIKKKDKELLILWSLIQHMDIHTEAHKSLSGKMIKLTEFCRDK